jgi:hypothetical protein
MPIVLATQEAEIRRIMVPSQPWQIIHKTLSRKSLHIRLVEWLKVKALSLNHSTAKKKKKETMEEMNQFSFAFTIKGDKAKQVLSGS